MRPWLAVVALGGSAAAALGCGNTNPGADDPRSATPPRAAAPPAPTPPAAPAEAPPAPPAAAGDAAPPPPVAPPDDAIDPAVAATRLFGGTIPDACAASAAPVACMVDLAYARDPRAATAAGALFAETGDLVSPGETEDMDGGYRGIIHLVPAWPVGRDRGHLQWVLAAARDFDAFFAALPASDRPLAYRWRDLDIRFVRSVGKRTPSAFASPWTFSYNVVGSLLTSETAVRETLFHEIFHMNDAAHGDWSARALRTDYDAIIARCGTTRASNPCLARYAPGFTKVRNGTYYAFQQDNGDAVNEYAAELALRYYVEQRQMLHAHRLARPAFKCGAPENARAWAALIDEFFGGRDLTPGC